MTTTKFIGDENTFFLSGQSSCRQWFQFDILMIYLYFKKKAYQRMRQQAFVLQYYRYTVCLYEDRCNRIAYSKNMCSVFLFNLIWGDANWWCAVRMPRWAHVSSDHRNVSAIWCAVYVFILYIFHFVDSFPF